ncbi:MAG: FIST C-terminal domain-containing protein [Christensenellaceae bacterium]|jgi:hypothetical protein|nr:FIST C-terminal domain-containing protein [Christensenellaceae bacterium]
MIKFLCASTYEIDNVDLAVSEILEQLDLEKNALKHSVALLTCFPEFIQSGVLSAICEALPFDTIGTTTVAAATTGKVGALILSISVLTSDDAQFVAVNSDEITSKDADSLLSEAYSAALAKLDGVKPALMLTYGPLLVSLSGEDLVDKLNEITNGLPIYGTISLDHNEDYHEATTIFNGEVSATKLAFLLIGGNDINPSFGVATISPERIRDAKATVTEAADNILKSVNNISVYDYFKSLGLVSPSGVVDGINVIPFVLDYKDGTEPVVRAIFMISPDGHAVCGGNIPIGSSLSIGSLDRDDILATTGKVVASNIVPSKNNVVLLFSCLARNLALGTDNLAEMQVIEKLLQNRKYHFSYSGGEICPVYDSANKKWVNRFHNETITYCLI